MDNLDNLDNFILVDGDKAKFNDFFGVAKVFFPAGKPLEVAIKASGDPTLLIGEEGKKICLKKDIKKVSLKGCSYTTGVLTTQGAGDISITALNQDQIAPKITIDGEAVILKRSGNFQAQFKVRIPATNNAGAADSPGNIYTGSGSFKTSQNKKLKVKQDIESGTVTIQDLSSQT